MTNARPQEALAGFRVATREPLSQWIEANIRLPQGLCASPGAMRLYVYQRGIADALGDPEIERISVQKSARVGFSVLLTSCIAAMISNDPSAVIVLQPTEGDCRDYMVSDVEPLLEASGLGQLAEISGSRTERSTILHRVFPGGSLKVLAARSPRNLRRHTARVLLCDEIDGYEVTAEGDPVALAIQRTMTFPDRKIVLGSTPTDEDTSQILRAYAQSDRRVFEVPCPECGGLTEIMWKHIEWEPDRPETAAFRCPHCAALVAESHKPAMVAAGRWRATAPEVRGHAGFRINSLVSPLTNARWATLVREFLAARHDSDLLRVFINTILGEGWREAADEVDETDLASRAEGFDLDTIPEEVLSVTAGVDVQQDRLECSLVGWARDGAALVLDHQVIWGSPEDDETWRELDALLRSRWRHPLGGQIGVDAACVDSGGHWTDVVYGFCLPRLGRRVWAIKGVAGPHVPAFSPSRGKVKGRAGRLFLVGVDGIKASILSRLSRGRTIRFGRNLQPQYYEQLASERRVVRWSRGQPAVRFERKPGMAAEGLDCLVYAWAAHAGAPLQAERREAELRQAPLPSAMPTTIRSAWLER